MKKYLERLPKEIQDLISLVSELGYSSNTPVYLVGGFVRDLILEVKNLDLDIVVEGDGIKFAEALSLKLDGGLTMHRRFGTATVTLKKHMKIDVASSRQEFYPQPANLPEVRYGVLKDDLLRRDFTINAMAISISRHDFGRFIDSYGGRQDLADKKIRVLHNLSFIDDPTRMLRAIRFEQRYNFKIEPKTLNLLKQAIRLRMLKKVQPQRLRDELILILKEERPLRPLNRIKGMFGFDFISRGLSLSKKTSVFLKSIERQTNWFKEKYPKRRQLDSWLIYLIGLMEPLNINRIKLACKKFAFRKGEEKRILAFKKISPKFIKSLNRANIKPSELFSLLEPLSYEVIILIKAKFKGANLKMHIEDFLEAYNGMRIHISGEDLHRLGLTPGPFYQKIFHRVLNAKLDGLVKTKEEELKLIQEITARHK